MSTDTFIRSSTLEISGNNSFCRCLTDNSFDSSVKVMPPKKCKRLFTSFRRSSRSKLTLKSDDNNNSRYKNGSERSIGTSQLSDLVSVYCSDLCVMGEEEDEKECESDSSIIDRGSDTFSLLEERFKDSKLELLHDELSMLYQNIDQILKAINCDKVRHGKSFSSGRLEAEKILLTLDIKQQLILRDIISFSRVDTECQFNAGDVYISNIVLAINKISSADRFFVSVAICGSDVYASQVCDIRTHGVICFDDFVFKNLQPNFKIILQLYSVPDKKISNKSEKSLFRLWGETHITMKNVSKICRSKLKVGNGCIVANIFGKANLNVNLAGFINVSHDYKKYPFWSRQWCILSGRSMKYLNYPLEASFEIAPRMVINLESECKEVRRVGREECVRKNTLALRTRSGRIISLCFDHEDQMVIWWKYINIVRICIQTWEC